MRTKVAIVGAGPAGLVLARLLELSGVDTVVLEARSHRQLTGQVGGGVLEHATADLLAELGIGGRMQGDGLVQRGIELRTGGSRHRLDLSALTGGRRIVVYGQDELVTDLLAAREAAGRPLLFEHQVVSIEMNSHHARLHYRHGGRFGQLDCAVVVGADGFHGVCRQLLPARALHVYQRGYPFAWLGVLAAVPPATPELVYARHPHGFALHGMRPPGLSRLYLQCDPADELADWPDERIWSELHRRLAVDGWALAEGPILAKAITPVQSFVAEPLRHGRLFLAGDAAHLVPPTAAKGLNLAIADAATLAPALVSLLRTGREQLADAYSAATSRRVWRAQDFSDYLTAMVHIHADPFENRRQQAQLDFLADSPAAATALAQNYVGFPLPD